MSSASASAATQSRKRKYRPQKADATAKRRQKWAVDPATGIQAIAVTCVTGKEKQCAAEMMNWLTESLDRHFPASTKPQSQPASSASAATAADQLELELQALRGSGDEKQDNQDRIRQVSEQTLRECCGHSKSLVMFQIKDESVDPADLCVRMCRDVAETGRLHTRFTLRLYPLHVMFFSTLEKLELKGKDVVERLFKSVPLDQSYGIRFERRVKNKNFQREDVIPAVARMVPRGHPIDLKRPDHSLLVQCLGRVSGLGLVHNYEHLHRMNVRTLAQASTTATDTSAAPATPTTDNSQK